jgi:hypothetical protein
MARDFSIFFKFFLKQGKKGTFYCAVRRHTGKNTGEKPLFAMKCPRGYEEIFAFAKKILRYAKVFVHSKKNDHPLRKKHHFFKKK